MSKLELILENIHEQFRCLIAFLVFERKWTWLEWIISTLATAEMEFPLIFDDEFRDDVNTSDVVINYPMEEQISFADKEIPKNTFYCEGCIFSERSKIAKFFYGYQSCGYCYYLGKGDFSFIKPTDILWDGCKCCNKFEDIENELYDEQ